MGISKENPDCPNRIRVSFHDITGGVSVDRREACNRGSGRSEGGGHIAFGLAVEDQEHSVSPIQSRRAHFFQRGAKFPRRHTDNPDDRSSHLSDVGNGHPPAQGVYRSAREAIRTRLHPPEIPSEVRQTRKWGTANRPRAQQR